MHTGKSKNEGDIAVDVQEEQVNPVNPNPESDGEFFTIELPVAQVVPANPQERSNAGFSNL